MWLGIGGIVLIFKVMEELKMSNVSLLWGLGWGVSVVYKIILVCLLFFRLSNILLWCSRKQALTKRCPQLRVNITSRPDCSSYLEKLCLNTLDRPLHKSA